MIGLIGVLNNPATANTSHSAGMVNVVSKLFDATLLNEKDDWSDYDRLIIYHGPNFKPGSFNVIGGINPGILERAEMLSNYKGEVESLDGFQLNEFSKKRKIDLYNNHQDFKTIELPDKYNLAIGDSHSISIWPNETYTLSRNDGKTLYGFLKQEMDLSKYKQIIFYFGNIDIRFHLARQANPEQATKELFKRYCDYASKYDSTITQLLPIEDESRIIPKSGQYKGANFFGSISQRKNLRDIANNVIEESSINFLSWPDFFYDHLGNLKFEIMEPKQSVHIKPMFYLKNIKTQLKLF